MTITVDKVILNISPPVKVTGQAVGGGGREFEYMATKCIAVVAPRGAVHSFQFEGPRVMKSTGEPRGWSLFVSEDRGLNEARLCARRIAAPAQQRAESGAR